MVILRSLVLDRGVLRQDRDALFALEVTRVEDAVLQLLMGVKCPGLAQHGVDKGGFAVVHVGHDGNISEVVS